MICIGACSYINLQTNSNQSKASDSKFAKKFNKYLQRIQQIIDGTNKKVPNTPENLYKLAAETNNLSAEVANILQNIDKFQFEERKMIQSIIQELYNNFQEVFEITLYPKRIEIVQNLLLKYTEQGMAIFVGSFLRLFTKSSKLIDSMLSVKILEELSSLIANPDFSISSDSYETFKKSVREYYITCKDRLKTIMVDLLNENKSIQYEAFLLLSMFLLVPQPDDSESVPILIKNRGMLDKFIIEFQNDREEDNFKELKNAMRESLQQLN
eukprot:403375236